MRQILDTYVSADELERAAAFAFGYIELCQHPREVRSLELGGILVFDLDHIAFDDRTAALAVAHEAARRGVLVGIHTYFRDDPRLTPLRAIANVRIAKTHKRLLVRLRRFARLHGRPWKRVAKMAKRSLKEVSHVRVHASAVARDFRPGDPSAS